MKGYIYRYTFKDGKVYIGQTRRPMALRHSEHINPSTGPLNPSFWAAFQKLGMPKLEIIKEVESDDVTTLVHKLNVWETVYIEAEKAADPKCGYNINKVGMAYSPDVNILNKEYARLCQQHKENKRLFFTRLEEKLYNGWSDDLNDEEKEFVRKYLCEVDISHTESVQQDERSEFYWDEDEESPFGGPLALAKCIYYGEIEEEIAQYVYAHADDIIQKYKEKNTIQQIDKEGKVVKEYLSWDEIRSAFNLTRVDNIINVIKGRQKSAYGYFWRYKPIDDTLEE